jgi:hypothetical protein
MKKKEWRNQFLIIGAIAILFISSLPVVIGDNQEFNYNELEENVSNKSTGSTFYSNCLIFVSGKCNDVNGPLVWLIGAYCPLFKRTFTIRARGQGDEALNVFIIGTQPLQIGTFYDYENIRLTITRARGLLYWAEKSIISKSNSLFAFCNAESILVTT